MIKVTTLNGETILINEKNIGVMQRANELTHITFSNGIFPVAVRETLEGLQQLMHEEEDRAFYALSCQLTSVLGSFLRSR